MDKISENITYGEAVKSQTASRLGIDNTPNEAQLANMALVATKCFEPLRKWWGKPIGISSFFRCEALNKAVGGSATSQHVSGMAIDIDADIFGGGLTNIQIFEWLRHNVEYDQIIKESPKANGDFEWVHISYCTGKNRKQAMQATFINGKPIYNIV